MKKIIKILFKIVIAVVVIIGGFLAYFTINDYQPEKEISLLDTSEFHKIKKTSYNILSWNIGYAGLGADMDFFYDGGKQVRTSYEKTLENLSSIKSVLENQRNVDFILLQEVDVQAKRSYYINEKDTLEKVLPNYLSIYADNYLVDFVPVPISEPMGAVKAGLLTMSTKVPMNATRYAFPGNYDWPTSLFMLDRCFIASRYRVEDGKDFIIINTHNSAFDDGSLKKQQLEYLKKFLEVEAENGNYFVVGGDWNQNPPGLNTDNFGKHSDSESFILSTLDRNIFPSNWQLVFDNEQATNRSNIKPYIKGETSTTVLDFFLVSPNIKVNFVSVVDLNFQNSDHQPIIMNFELQ
ncbi:MAG: endonuclease/exonuclease/phosphatase family protein [Bacteroidales bacterium]|nr:endonuclease/exonuclease/phosphatase family protein [Bacteroidales bacterium]